MVDGTRRTKSRSEIQHLMTQLLASISSSEEAHIALQTAIGILDIKDPSQGALGALAATTIAEIVKLAAGTCPTSATIGDLAPDPELVLKKTQATAELGVDYIKIGIFGEDWLLKCLPSLQTITTHHKLVGVLFADHFANLSGPCHLFKAAGFSGVMVDTANKANGSVRTMKSDSELMQFVQTVRNHNLLCGIAGSLKPEDIKPLTMMMPDYLGFRTALCENHVRQGKLSTIKIQQIAETIANAKNL